MIRVNIVVEGQTEESFIADVLAPTFWPRDIFLTPILLGIPGHKGGRPNYARVRKDVLLHMKQDHRSYCSTMLDYYGLGPGFPGTPVSSAASNIDKVLHIEDSMKADICAQIPNLRPDVRFVPYLQLHEYEALLFSEPESFAEGINQPGLASVFRRTRDDFATPEDINHNPVSAPSKRVLSAYPQYRKVVHGTMAATAVGVEAMRRECPHFRSWLEGLERLA